MTPLQTLRNATRMAFLAMLWFALTLAAAVVTPWLNAPTGMVICSAGGTRMQPIEPDGTPVAQSGLHCPLCLSTLAAAPPAFQRIEPILKPGHAAPRFGAGLMAVAVTVRPPPRGPPIYS